jgi:hypothetical protein
MVCRVKKGFESGWLLNQFDIFSQNSRFNGGAKTGKLFLNNYSMVLIIY